MSKPSMLEYEKILNDCTTLLEKLGFSPAEVIILTFGEDLISLSSEVIPDGIKVLIIDLLSEQSKATESMDPIDKKLHSLQVELLDFIIKKRINWYSEVMEETHANRDTR